MCKTACSSLFQLLHYLQYGKEVSELIVRVLHIPWQCNKVPFKQKNGALAFAYRAAGLTAAMHTLIS